MQFHSTLSLPAIRAAQLRHVAHEKNATSADIVDSFIRAAWTDVGGGVVLPGFDFAACLDDDSGEPVVTFVCTGSLPVLITPEQAHEVASGIRDLLAAIAARFEVDAICEGSRACFIGTRKGRGFTIQLLDNLNDPGRKPVTLLGLTASIAADLAEAFETFAKRAEALR